MMDDGNLDAIVVQSAVPSPALRQPQSTGKHFRLIPLPAAVIAKVSTDHPYFSPFTIPAAMYGTSSDIKTLNSTNMVIVDSDMSEEVVYQILNALMADIEKIRASHPSARSFSLDTAASMPVPLHPGC